MKPYYRKLLDDAEKARLLYKQGLISREECFQTVILYIDAYNAKSKATAKKYGVPAKTLNFQSFIR